MIINKELKNIFENNNIDSNNGILYLLSVYFSIPNNIFSREFILKVLSTKIIEFDNNNTIWNIPLFEGQNMDKFEWVKEYRDAFKKINPERAGNLNTCVLRFKKFFSENPEVRVEDVKNAVNMYFRSISSPQYLMKSHNFIYMDKGANKTSELEVWLEKYFDTKTESEGRVSKTNTMQ